MSDFEKLWAEQKADPEFKDYCDEMQPAADIANAVLAARVHSGLTQKEMSKLSGIPQADISRLESCDSNPSLKTLQRIAKALNRRLKIDFVPID